MASLIPWSRAASGPLNRLRTELEEMFGRFGDESLFANGDALKAWQPRVDVEETDKEITVKADLPGVDPKDIDVQVLDGVLTLKGEKKEEKEEKTKNYHRVERFAGSFYRAIPLPAGADADKVVAKSAKGVLTITIPKKPELQPKKITVKSQD
jgi:HSP20 family protein